MSGGAINLMKNDLLEAIIPPGFNDFRFCFPTYLIDEEKDEFQLRITTNDYVIRTNSRTYLNYISRHVLAKYL